MFQKDKTKRVQSKVQGRVTKGPTVPPIFSRQRVGLELKIGNRRYKDLNWAEKHILHHTMELAWRLEYHMVRFKLTKKELAKKLKVSPYTLRLMLNGNFNFRLDERSMIEIELEGKDYYAPEKIVLTEMIKEDNHLD